MKLAQLHSLLIVLPLLCSTISNAQHCCNVTDPGEIGPDISNCGPFDPSSILSIEDASGGVGPVEYMWLYSDTLVPNTQGNPYWQPIANSNSNTYDPGLLTETTYFIRCSRNANCNVFVGESNVVTITIYPAVTATSSSSGNTCYNSCDGSAAVNVTGGTAPFTYAWSNGETTTTATGLCAGTAAVTVEDANGCTLISNITVTEPAPNTIQTTSTAVSCFGVTDGTATANALGGTAPYTYQWSNGETTASIMDLGAGAYDVTTTDANGCVATVMVDITEPDELQEVLTSSDLLCYGDSSGSAGLVINGGTAPYSIAWGNGATSAHLNNVPAGQYPYTITDNNGCMVTGEAVITQPDELELSIFGFISLNACNGQAFASVSGGTTPYNYVWSTGDYTQMTTNFCAGDVTVKVEDANGCVIELCRVIGPYGSSDCAQGGSGNNNPPKGGGKSASIESPGVARNIETSVSPNPFKSSTMVNVNLTETSYARVEVFNTSGQRVAVLHQGFLEGGTDYQFNLDAAGLTPGIYMYTIITDLSTVSKQILLMQ